jgi:hypothetical protein
MSSLLNHMVKFDEMLDEAEEEIKDQEENEEIKEQDFDIDPLDRFLDNPGGDENLQSAFHVMKDLMSKFKDFCDCCENAWKVQELPAALRQRLITLDQLNQDKYQKLYVMIQKYADEMRNSYIRSPGNDD